VDTSNISKLPVVLWGAGNLAWSLVGGILRRQAIAPSNLRVTNLSDEYRLGRFRALGLRCSRERATLLDGAGTVVLLVKPQDALTALGGMAAGLRPGMLLISAVAGLELDTVRSLVPPGVHLVRAMPNTSSQVGQAATAFAVAPGIPVACVDWTRVLLQTVGTAHMVDESQLDAVTAVSGSGPAYFYYFCESLIKAAEQAGLESGLARSLAVQTLHGAAAMLAEPGADPAALRAAVTSARGTTEAGLEAMAQHRLPDAVIQGVLSATARARELGSHLSSNSQPHRPGR